MKPDDLTAELIRRMKALSDAEPDFYRSVTALIAQALTTGMSMAQFRTEMEKLIAARSPKVDEGQDWCRAAACWTRWGAIVCLRW